MYVHTGTIFTLRSDRDDAAWFFWYVPRFLVRVYSTDVVVSSAIYVPVSDHGKDALAVVPGMSLSMLSGFELVTIEEVRIGCLVLITTTCCLSSGYR